jgi:NADPH:quinone reductase-like Zn-dependent oxidoreductase
MLAAYVNKFCELGTVPDKICFGKIAAPPPPKKNQVIISVKAASINVDDVALLQNTVGGGTLSPATKPSAETPLVGGWDFAGVVHACGPNCQRVKVGDRVCGLVKQWYPGQTGTWAELTLTSELDVCLIEDDQMSFVDAAAVAMASFVDFGMLAKARKKLEKPGCRCLVLGASGALGSVMVQLLHKKGVHVTGVCSGANEAVARKKGADEVVDYTKGPVGEQLAGAAKFSVVFDFVGGRELENSVTDVVDRGGLYVTAVGEVQNANEQKLSGCKLCGVMSRAVRRMMCGSCCCAPYAWAILGNEPPLTAEMWKTVVLDAGARAAIAEEVPFAEAPLRAALSKVWSKHPGGRLVLNLERLATASE